MSTQNLPRPSPLARRPSLRIVSKRPAAQSIATLPVFFWIGGTILAAGQAWIYRYHVSADSVSYLDMSDAVLPGFTWHRLINGVWSPLYPLLLGLFRRAFSISSGNEIVAVHLLNIGVFAFAFLCFDFFLKSLLQRVEPGHTLGPQRELVLLPRWAYTSVAYALFLWGSISAISLRSLRPDMLMSGFVYLAIGLLLRMQGAPGRWKDYLALGTSLGIGSLAKAPVHRLAFYNSACDQLVFGKGLAGRPVHGNWFVGACPSDRQPLFRASLQSARPPYSRRKWELQLLSACGPGAPRLVPAGSR